MLEPIGREAVPAGPGTQVCMNRVMPLASHLGCQEHGSELAQVFPRVQLSHWAEQASSRAENMSSGVICIVD